MKVEITIDCQKKLPDGAVPALEKELLRRLDQNFNNCSLVIRRTSSDGLTVLGGMDGDKKRIEEILQDTWKVLMTGSVKLRSSGLPGLF